MLVLFFRSSLWLAVTRRAPSANDRGIQVTVPVLKHSIVVLSILQKQLLATLLHVRKCTRASP